MIEWLHWSYFGVGVLLAALIAYLVVRAYSDKDDRESLTTVVTTASLLVAVTLFLVTPLDVMYASNTRDDHGMVWYCRHGGGDARTVVVYSYNETGHVRESQSEIDNNMERTKSMYYVLYALVSLFCFAIVPFAYFYYEEYDVDVRTATRVSNACKYVLMLLVIVVIVLATGMLLHSPSGERKDWKKSVLDSENKGDAAITFLVSVLTLIGFSFFISYGAIGLAVMPIDMIFDLRQEPEDLEDTSIQGIDNAQARNLARQIRSIEARYMGDPAMPKKERDKLDQLRRRERLLVQRNPDNARLPGQYETGPSNSSRTFWKVLWAPFRTILGVAGLLLSLLLITSIIISASDRFIHSECGYSCGYVLDKHTYYNPMDDILLRLSHLYPLDYIALLTVVIYLMLCLVSGVSAIGVRFLWVRLFDVKPHKTEPQGLLFLVIITMLSLLSVQSLLLLASPQYLTFGSERIALGNDTVQSCSMSYVPDCTMTMTSVIYNRISLSTPLFGSLFYYAACVSVVVAVISMMYACCRGKKEGYVPVEQQDDAGYV